MPVLVINPFISHASDAGPPPSSREVLLTTSGQTETIAVNETILFRDEGGTPSNYSNGSNYDIVFDSEGDGFTLNFNNFAFEQSTYSQYDRLGFQHSNNNSTWENFNVSWMQTSATTTAPWSTSFGGSNWNSSISYPGWILPSTVARAQSAPLNFTGTGTVTVTQRYIRATFFSDGSVNQVGWDIEIARGT